MLDNFSGQTNLMNAVAIRGRWLDKADEIFSSLKERQSQKESWWKSMTTTVSLLKQARQIISQSEHKIKEQEQRIEELKRLSNTDELTGILNRRGFMQAFTRELDRANRDKSQGGLLIMIDLDNFKSINDSFGHEAGDLALKLVASTLANDTRKMDIAGRLGGDEFTVLFANTTRRESLVRAQNLIKALNNLSFIWKGKEIPVRASLGLKEYKKGSTARNIFNAADASMYENKRQTSRVRIKQDNKAM